LVVGSVRRAGQKIRVSAELIEVSTERVVWSNVYDRDLTTTNLFTVQDDITRSIVGTIASGYGVIAQVTRGRDRAAHASLSSYECVLRAYHYFEYFQEVHHRRARDCLEEAVIRDPEYADAWGWLAILYANEHAWGFNRREDPLGRALTAGNNAVRANRNSQMAWEGKAAAHFFLGQREEFHVAAQKALSLNPNNVGTTGNLAWYYMNFGDYEHALPLAQRAISLSPYPPFWYHHPFWQKHYFDGEYELALEYAKKGEGEIFPCYMMLAATYAELGDKSQAVFNVKRLLQAKPDIASAYRPWTKSLHWPPELVDKVAVSMQKAGLALQ
jgi:tetratricopeptide (TPR) repeat protein